MRNAIAISAALFAFVAESADAQVWVYSVCGMKLNQFTGQIDSSLPTVEACGRILDAQAKVVTSRRKQDRLQACRTLKDAFSALAMAKASTGLAWFGDFVCTRDCEGHRAGYDWATRQALDSKSACPQDHGQSFNEGCWQHVRELDRQKFIHENCQVED